MDTATANAVRCIEDDVDELQVSITSDIDAHSLPGWQKETADAFADAKKEE